MRLIDADKLSLHLADWAMAEAPDERTPNKAKEYTAKDMQQMIYRTIKEAIKAVDKAPTVYVREKGLRIKSGTLVADKTFGEMMKRKRKEPYIPPCIEPGALDGINMQVVELPITPVFEFTPIKPRKKEPDPLEEQSIDFEKIQEAYDKLVAAEPEVVEINEWQMCEAGYRLALLQAREAIEAEFRSTEDPGFKKIAPGLLIARAKIKEMEKL